LYEVRVVVDQKNPCHGELSTSQISIVERGDLRKG
jgi:hypothetical protein